MASITNELVTNFSFTGDISTLTKYNASFSDALGLMAKGVGIIGAVTGAMYGFANAQLDVINTLGNLSRETNTSVEFLQEMGYVASVNGGSIDSLRSSMIGLSEKIGEASIQGNEDFNRLGISVRNANGQVKSTEQVLNEVRQSFRGLSKEQQISFAQKLGIDKGLLQTLNLSNAQLDETRKKIRAIGIVSQKDAERVIAFKDSITTSQMALSSIGKQVALNMLPNMQNLINGFNDLIFSNADLIKNGLTKTFYWLNSVSSAVVNTGKSIVNAIDYFVGLENALMIAGASALYFGRALYLNPVGAIVAGISGLILVVDDLYNAFTGGQSVIKDFFDSFDIDIVNTLKNVFDGLTITFNSFLSLALQVSEAITSLVLVGARAGNFLGMDIDTSGIEEFRKMQQETRMGLNAENSRLINDIASRNLTTSQNVTVTQNIQGNDAQRVADLSNQGIENAINSANAQVGKGGR